MHIRRLLLRNVRTYEAADLHLGPGVTAFLGSNGQGKTNIVEAVAYLATHGSHRVATDAPLVRTGESTAFIGAEVQRDGRIVQIDIEIVPGRSNRVRLNRSPVRLRDALGLLQVVLFAPEDLQIVKGDPSDRRAFIDTVLVQRSARIAGVRADYERVLRQRNALLKSAGGARRADSAAVEATLSVWDEQLVTLGADLAHARSELIGDLRPDIETAYDDISAGRGPVRAVYACAWAPDAVTREDFTAALQEQVIARRRDELDRGITLVGPHRDDLTLTLHADPVRGYASHGESWSVALALRLASFELLRRISGEDPVLILDDVFAELDTSRRACLARRIDGVEQVLITAAVEEDVPVGAAASVFEVRRGEVSPRD